MQERRNKRLAVILVVLTSTIVLLAFLSRPESTFLVDKNLFKDFDLKSVDRIQIESPTGKTKLAYQGYRWMVNDSIEADRGLVEVLFATLQQAEPKRPVATSLRDSLSKALNENGHRVTLYSGQDAVKTFFAGGNAEKTQAFFMEASGSEPYVMIIPGYRVYVAGIFEVPAFAWKEKLIFNFNWQNFSKLEAHYKNPAGDFDVLMQKNQVYIPGIEADTAKLNSYLDNISLLAVEEYIAGNKLTDSLERTVPLLQIVIADVARREYRLLVFNAGTHFYAKTGDDHWAILPENRVRLLLRPKEYFVKK